MGILRKLFGGGEPKPGSAEAKRRADDMLLEMQGIHDKVKYSGGHPVCPKCEFKFPMAKEQVESQGGINVTVCPKCNTKLAL